MRTNMIKEPIKVRTRKLSNGNEAIYLDIIYDGQRVREYLKLYLLAGNTRDIKLRNKETMELANAVKAKRTIALHEGKYDLCNKQRKDILLMDFFKFIREDALENKSANFCGTMKSTMNYLEKYINGKRITFKDVDRKFVEGFIKFLKVTPSDKHGALLGRESIYTYYMCFCITLNKAVKKGIIEKNPCDLIPTEEKPQRGESNREYLTMDEVKKLIATPCRDVRVKRMFLFSCFTGLRYKDIFLLKWKNFVQLDEDKWQVETIQKKTKSKVVIPLTENAMKWVPERYSDGDDNRPFVMPETSVAYDILHQWTKAAGIRKHVTFHVARHTYATMLLFYGADLYTVSKLLGHKNMTSTQIYAKVMDESKRKAVNLIPNI